MFENIPKIGDRVKLLRIIRGFSQSELSKAIGKSHGYIARFENGRCPPKPFTVMKICEAFDISMKDFFDLDIETVVNFGFFDGLHRINDVEKRKLFARERFIKLCHNNPQLQLYMEK